MTPAQRVGRIQRWLAAADCEGIHDAIWMHELLLKRHHDHECDESANCHICSAARLRGDRMEKACLLFATELAWLCEYAIGLRELVDDAASFANNFGLDVKTFDCRAQGILQLSPVSGPVVSDPTFVCGNCQRDVPLSQSTDGRLPYLCDECICYEAGSTIQAERTCSGCMHHVTPSKHFEGSKRCELKRVYFDDCALACPQFNAPSGLQWEYGVATGSWWLCRSEVTIGRVIDRAYSESGQHEAHTKSDVIATGTLHDCARALVEHAKGDR